MIHGLVRAAADAFRKAVAFVVLFGVFFWLVVRHVFRGRNRQ